MPHNNHTMYASYHKSYEDAVRFVEEEYDVQTLAERQRILNPQYACRTVGEPEVVDVEPYAIRDKLGKTIAVCVEL